MRSRFRSLRFSGKRPRRGAVAVMALIIVLVSAIILHAYMSRVISDMKTGDTFDQYAQLDSERVAIGNLLKESILEYYEIPRQSGVDDVGSMKEIFQGLLDQMSDGTAVSYTISDADWPTLPSNVVTSFWKNLETDSSSDTALDGDFVLANTDLFTEEPWIARSKIACYMPGDSAGNVLEVISKSSDGTTSLFTFVVTRSSGDETVTYTYYVHMFQVPVTDYNLISYAIADKLDDVPEASPAIPDAISASISSGDINALSFRRIDDDIGIMAGGSFPFSCREQFSSGSILWEWVFYDSSSSGGTNYLSGIFKSDSNVYFLSIPDSTVISHVYISNDDVTEDVTAQDGSTGFDPTYYSNADRAANHMVDEDGYYVDADGNYLDSSGARLDQQTGVDGNLTEDTNGDGVITSEDTTVVYLGEPVCVDWTIDLNAVALPDGETLRRIYVQLPDTDTPDVTFTIEDSNHGDTTISAPVVFCIEGWARAQEVIEGIATFDGNFPLYLQGDLTDQPLMLYAVGTDVQPADTCTMDGVLLFDDKLCNFSSSGVTLTVNGTVAVNGNVAGTADTDSVNLSKLVISKPTADNAFRYLAPRYLLVDVQSKMDK